MSTMSFLPDEDQRDLSGLVATILADLSTDERVAGLDAQPGVWDVALFETLVEAGVVEALVGDGEGDGMGSRSLILVAEQCGRYLARVPLVSTVVAAEAMREAGRTDLVADVARGAMTVSFAVPDAVGSTSLRDGRLTGSCALVFGGRTTTHLLAVTDGGAVAVVPAAAKGVTLTEVGWGYTEDVAVTFDVTADDVIVLASVDPTITSARWQVGLASLAVGACRSAVARTAAYVSERNQFGAPLSTKQGVAMRAADAHIDTECMWLTTMNAAAALDDAGQEVNQVLRATGEAAWWAADAGVRVVHATQHLHGGMGADTDNHIHRFFTFVRGIGHLLGPTDALLGDLGETLIRIPKGALS